MMTNTTVNAPNCGKADTAELEEKIRLYARVSHYVLITGERGTGKTTIARQLHDESPRAKKDFVNLNCASLSPELLESALFGYEKGAFTGATAPKAGLFETASGGTIFLDEEANTGRRVSNCTRTRRARFISARRTTETSAVNFACSEF